MLMLSRQIPDFDRPVHALLGLPFDAVGLADACAVVRRSVSERTPLVLVTPNSNFVVSALDKPGFRGSILRAGLSTLDGMVLLWLARFVGVPLPERVTGADLFVALRTDETSQPRIKVFLFGGPDGVAEMARQKVNASAKGIEVVGSLSPGYAPVAELGRDEYLAHINATSPDFLVVSLGAIKGHEWIELFRHTLTAPVVSHLGAVVNFEAGRVRRAPRGFQRLGLEWLWRILQEPILWRRYGRDGMQLIRLVLTRLVPYRIFMLRHRRALLAKGPEPSLQVEQHAGLGFALTLGGAWCGDTCDGLRIALRKAAEAPGLPVIVDLSRTTYVDSAVIGLFMLLRGTLDNQERPLEFRGVSSDVGRIFHFTCAEYLLDASHPASAKSSARTAARTDAQLTG